MIKPLPLTAKEMHSRGWKDADFVLVSGDAYIDHPSFGTALIGRYLENLGYRVCIIAQPDWREVEAFRIFGRPNLGFLITAGNLDSMVNHYTSSKKRRRRDVYSPGGITGNRPDRAVIVYTGMAKQAYKGIPVILGGIEASLRRLSHYDYWSNALRRSVLLDSKADLLVYGMGEHQIAEIAALLQKGTPPGEITHVKGTVWKTKTLPDGSIALPAYENIKENRKLFAESFALRIKNRDPLKAAVLAESYGDWFAVQNTPALPLSREEMDDLYNLPFTRNYHPSYHASGGVPALDEVKFSITSSRGCFGGCSFCSLSSHQGRNISSRSHESILKEAESFTEHPDFKGYIHDIGGPTANFRHSPCGIPGNAGLCSHRECLFPGPCRNLKADHDDYLSLLRKVRILPGIKKVFIRSGIRFDYMMYDKDDAFFRELVEHHVSGQLKVAPEHVSEKVLDAMGKPQIDVYEKFSSKFYELTKNAGKKQYLLPYFITAHPGSDMNAAIELAEYLKKHRFIPEQVQEFYPTPDTIATCMYYTGIDPRNMKAVYVPESPEERAMQRALIHFHKSKNYPLVRKALIKAGRMDLIGYGKDCLVPPESGKRKKNRYL